jgi:uncharacterized protein YdaU (DUF1376 family)
MFRFSQMKIRGEMFWTDRWTGSSAFLLPLEARGLYREMLTQAWRRGAQLPNDPQAIQRAVGATADEWARTWPLVRPYWRADGDVLVNDTQRAIYGESERLSQSARTRGHRGNLIRWGKGHA